MENFATEFMTKLDGKLTPEQMKTVLMELEMFSANFDIEKKITEILNDKLSPLELILGAFFLLNQIYVLIDFFFRISYIVNSRTGVELMM